MTRNIYKRLGEFIAPYLEKNVGRKVTLSQGINNNKYFQAPRQVAVDSENDQIVHTGQFAYNKATTRNGDKISIAYREGPDCTVSSAYQVFYIKDEDKLNPYYLLMWFKRPEFDRYARFKSFGSAHEFFSWEEMCNVFMPIPDIDEQRKIVAKYKAVEQQIANNNYFIKTLEKTAQTIYHHIFIDNINPEHVKKDWQIVKLGTYCDINTDNLNSKDNYQTIRYLDTSSVTENVFEDFQILHNSIDEFPSRAKRKVKYNDLVYSTVRPNLRHYGIIKGDPTNVIVSTGFAVIRSNNPNISNELLYMILTAPKTIEIFNGIAEMSTTTYPSINSENIEDLKIAIPIVLGSEITGLNKKLGVIFDSIYSINQENKILSKILNLLLSRLS